MRGGNHLEAPGVDGRIILRWIFKKWYVRAWTGSLQIRIETDVGTYECGNEHSGCIKCEEILD